MRRAGTADLWPQILAHENLLAAARRAARGKRHRASVARFLLDLEPEIFALQRELQAGRYSPRPMVTFWINDPKRRLIAVPAFRDRVLHQALIAVAEPIFERRMIAASFACRRGKGQHAALRHAQHLVRRHTWSLKLDVEHCFESLRHDVVLDTVQRVIKDRRVLALLDRIVRAGVPGAAPGIGLPIGSLTSQWLCNLTLDRLDHHVTERLRVPGYCRYLDDILLFAQEKHVLVAAHSAVEEYIGTPLGLRLKARATRLAPCRTGVPYLGWQVHAGLLRPRGENLRRTRRRLVARIRAHRRGELSDEQLADAVRGALAHLAQGDTRALQRAWTASWLAEPL